MPQQKVEFRGSHDLKSYFFQAEKVTLPNLEKLLFELWAMPQKLLLVHAEKLKKVKKAERAGGQFWTFGFGGSI